MGEITFLSEETTTCDMLFHFENDIRQMLICLQNLQDLSGSESSGSYTDDLIAAWLSADFKTSYVRFVMLHQHSSCKRPANPTFQMISLQLTELSRHFGSSHGQAAIMTSSLADLVSHAINKQVTNCNICNPADRTPMPCRCFKFRWPC